MISLMAVNLIAGPLCAIDWLFAIGAEDIITVAIFIIVAIISAISQYLNKKKEAAARQKRLERQAERADMAMAEFEGEEKPQRPQEPQRQFGRLPQRPQPKPAAAPVDQNVAAEIRDFLERAATGQPAARPKPVPPVVASPVIQAEEVHRPLADRPARHTSIERRPIPTSHTDERPAEAKVVPQRQPLTNQDRRRAEALRAKKQAEAKRRQAEAARAKAGTKQGKGSKFDHKLGSLRKQGRSQAASPPALTPSTMATDIAAMFADTQNIRQAIVINEVLTRPTHRWE